LSQVILAAILSEVLLKLLSLIFDMAGNLFVDISKEVINGGLASFNTILESFSDSISGLLTETSSVFWLHEATAREILFEALYGGAELRKKLLPLQHFLLVTIALGEVTG